MTIPELIDILSSYRGAVECFKKTLELAKVVPGSETNWTATYCNLGAAHRKLG